MILLHRDGANLLKPEPHKGYDLENRFFLASLNKFKVERKGAHILIEAA